MKFLEFFPLKSMALFFLMEMEAILRDTAGLGLWGPVTPASQSCS